MNTGDNFPKISRDEINEAMAHFFSKGGKIKKIKTVHNSITTIDPLATQEGSNWDGIQQLEFRFRNIFIHNWKLVDLHF